MSREIIVICGPTAVGKTKYAIETALHVGGEVVSCDSMQLYKYMDIGSAKPTPEPDPEELEKPIHQHKEGQAVRENETSAGCGKMDG